MFSAIIMIMKKRNTLFWIFFSLFFIQQAGLVVADSFSDHKHAIPAEMIGHHTMDHAMASTDGSSDMSMNKPCCKVNCHCGALGCGSALIFHVTPTQSVAILPDVLDSHYVFTQTLIHYSSLFRPPISI